MSRPPKLRGFAALIAKDPERQKRISRKGGQAAHEQGVAHEFTPAEARAAGSKGGKAVHAKNKEKES